MNLDGVDDVGPEVVLDRSAVSRYHGDADAVDAYAALLSFVGGVRLSTIAQLISGGDVPKSFVDLMRGVAVDELGPGFDDSAVVRERMRAIDPAVAFQEFFAALEERDQDIVRDRFSADPVTLRELGDRHGLTRERVRQIAAGARDSFRALLVANTMMMQRVGMAKASLGGLVDMRELRGLLHAALPMAGRLPVELDQPFFFLLMPEDSFKRLEKGSPWFAHEDLRRRLGEVKGRAHTDGLSVDRLFEALPELQNLEGLDHILAAVGLREVGGEIFARNASLNEVAVRLLRGSGVPLTFEDLVEVLTAAGSVRYLRNALLADDRIVRVDRDVFALAEWGLPEYSTVRDLIRQDLEAAGGEAAVSDIVERLTAGFDVRAASVLAYARGDDFVRVAPGVIRLRKDSEPIQDVQRPLESLRGCVRVGSRWAVRVTVTEPILRGFSVPLPAGLAAHFKVDAGKSATLPTDRSREISVVRRGLQDNIGRLRWVAEELGLVEGDMLFVQLPEREGDCISFAGVRRLDLDRANAAHRAGLMLGQSDSLSLNLARNALGMSSEAAPTEVVQRLRSRGEEDLAALVGQVLAEQLADDDVRSGSLTSSDE